MPELLLDTKPTVRTNNADAVVFVPDVAAFDSVKQGLASRFSEIRIPIELRYSGGGLVDLLHNQALAPDGKLRLSPDTVLNMAGFDRVMEATIEIRLDSGLVREPHADDLRHAAEGFSHLSRQSIDGVGNWRVSGTTARIG